MPSRSSYARPLIPSKIISLLGALLICLSGLSQSTTSTLPEQTVSPDALIEDFDTFQRIYQAANSGLYKYHPKSSIDSVFAVTRKRIDSQTTLLDLYRLIYTVTDYTGSLHSDNYLPGRVDSLVKSESSFFPYPVKIIGKTVLINTVHAPLPVGSQLLTINGRNVGDVIDHLGNYATTDGYNKTGKNSLISDHFSSYYRLEYGAQLAFDLTYRVPNGSDTAQLTVPAVSYTTYQNSFDRRHALPLEIRSPAFEFNEIDSLATARLTVRTFEMDDALQQRYTQFLDSTFRLLKRRPSIRYLIVDVRENGGGDDPNDLLLYSYLTNRTFRENKQAYTIFRKVPYPAFFVEEEPGDRKELEAELNAEHRSKARKGRYYLRRKENPRWAPNRNRFKGQIILLIGPQVASAGSLFASMVRSDSGPIVVGEETMGGYYGHTGHTPVEYQLPNTHIRLRFSIIDLEQDVRALPFIPPGRGVLPDYTVSETQASFLTNQDPVLAFALQYIRTISNQTRR